MQTWFYALADFIGTQLHANETTLAWLSAEESNFVRFNRNAVRQAGSVKQLMLTLSLIANQRRAELRISLSGERENDQALVKATIGSLRRDLGDLPEDPYLLFNRSAQSSEHIGEATLPSNAEMLDQVMQQGNGKDLVGLFASGAIYKGFANSLGQRNWHRVDNFNFEWCLYHAADKAVKNRYAGTHWKPAEFAQKMAASSTQLDILKRPPKALQPGHYRAYLAPAAVGEIVELLAWECFGVKSQRNKQSPLIKLEDGSMALHASVSLRENSHSTMVSCRRRPWPCPSCAGSTNSAQMLPVCALPTAKATTLPLSSMTQPRPVVSMAGM